MRARVRIRAAVVAAALAALLGPAANASARVPACPATVGASSAIVIEVSTDVVACARHPDRRMPIGSTTKLMTVLLALERAKLSSTFTAVRYHALPAESLVGLRPGERMKVADLIRGALVQSGNDAAMTLAVGVAGSERRFVKLMNARARKLGLKNTHYANPVGLDEPGNYSTARDLVTLATVLRTNPFFKRVVDLPQVTLHSGLRPRTFANRNDLVRRYGFVNGVKTGHTRDAGYVLVGSAYRNRVQLISAVLDTPSEAARDADTLALFAYAFPRFQNIRAVVKGRVLAQVPIRYRAGAVLDLVAARTVRRVVLRGHRRAVSLAIEAPHEVQGPIRRGERLGRVSVRQGGRVVATVPLVAPRAVPAANLAQRTKSWFRHTWVLVGVALAGFALAMLLARRRRGTRSGREPRGEARAA
ncbi:MAG TPA: D-alanyl-D-alanine carboxypeptidase family protein [Solirubrobacteraceae bacterium]